MNLQRRVLLKGVLALLSTPLWAGIMSTPLHATTPVSLKQFISLSQQLTRQRRLNQQMALNILLQLRAEPWGEAHVHRIMQKLTQHHNDNNQSLAPLDFNQLDDGERWFVGHLLTTWLTGIYFHQQGNQTVSYRHALMHEALIDLRPIPADCNQSFGFWQSPPENING